MARSFARIDVRRSLDPDWRALTTTQQAVYDFLLTSPKLTLCGSLDVKLGSWASLASDLDTASLVGVLDALEELGYIGWDRDTDELAIRTFVRHDGVLQNRNMGKGMWSSLLAVESEELRSWVVDNLPEQAWEPRFEPPFPQPRNRRPNQRYGRPSEPASEPPSRSHNPACSLHPPSVPESVNRSEPVDDRPPMGFQARLAHRSALHSAGIEEQS